MGIKKERHPEGHLSIDIEFLVESELGTSGNESLASLVGGVLAEVLDEAAGKILSLLLPLAVALVCVARIKDATVNARQDNRNLQIEERQSLGLNLVDGTVQDGIDDTTGVADGDALT